MKKLSMFQRFMKWTRFGRNGTAAGDALDGDAGGDAALAVADQDSPESADEAQQTLPAPIHAERLSQREETMLRIREGFRDLSGVLGNINTNIQAHTDTSRNIVEKIEVLPELLSESKKGFETEAQFLDLLNKQAVEAGLRQKEAVQNLRALPVALAAIQENEAAQYQVLVAIKDDMVRRTEIEKEMNQSFQKFDQTLNVLGDSTKQQAEHIKTLGASQKELVGGFNKVQARTIEAFKISQERTVDEFKNAQSEALHFFVQSQERMKKKFVWAVGVIAACIGVVAVVFFAMWMRALGDFTDSYSTLERRAVAVEEKASSLLKERDREIRDLRDNARKGQAEPAKDPIRESLDNWNK